MHNIIIFHFKKKAKKANSAILVTNAKKKPHTKTIKSYNEYASFRITR